MEDSLGKRPDLISAFGDPRVTAVWTDEFWAWNTHPSYGLSVVMIDENGKKRRHAVRHDVNGQRRAITELKEWLGTV